MTREAIEAMGVKTLKQEPCEDAISRQSIKQKLQEHHDFFVNAYGGFSNLPQSDKSRVDEITNCIAMVVNEPSVNPQEPKTETWSIKDVADTFKKHGLIREQEPKTGHWIEQIDHEENCRTLICSNCDRPALHDGDSIWKHKFCPHCGAKMIEPQESEEKE